MTAREVAYVLKYAHRSLRVDVLRRHEPPRFIGANGNQRNIGCAKAGAHLSKDGPVSVAGITGKPNASPMGPDQLARAAVQ